MKGKTCGICGKADGEVRQEFYTPNGRLTKNSVSFAHSWVLPAESCRDANGEFLLQKTASTSSQHRFLMQISLQHRMSDQAGVSEAGEADDSCGTGIEMLLC